MVAKKVNSSEESIELDLIGPTFRKVIDRSKNLAQASNAVINLMAHRQSYIPIGARTKQLIVEETVASIDKLAQSTVEDNIRNLRAALSNKNMSEEQQNLLIQRVIVASINDTGIDEIVNEYKDVKEGIQNLYSLKNTIKENITNKIEAFKDHAKVSNPDVEEQVRNYLSDVVNVSLINAIPGDPKNKHAVSESQTKSEDNIKTFREKHCWTHQKRTSAAKNADMASKFWGGGAITGLVGALLCVGGGCFALSNPITAPLAPLFFVCAGISAFGIGVGSAGMADLASASQKEHQHKSNDASPKFRS